MDEHKNDDQNVTNGWTVKDEGVGELLLFIN